MSTNHPGYGTDFEVLVPAYFCLNLIANDNVEDFSVRTNEKGFGNLDDSLFEIKLKNKEELFFAFQLKHAENSKNMTPASLYSSGKFDLRKYCETFSKFDEEKKKYHIILYTNKEFDPDKTRCVEKFVMEPQQNCPGEIFFATTEKKGVTKFGNIYKFGINKDDEMFKSLDHESYDQFFKRFSLYVGQPSFSDFQDHIKDIFENKYSAGLADSYIAFFRACHQDKYTNKRISKDIVANTLLTLLFNNCLLKNLSLFEPPNDGDKNLLQEAINSSDITLVEGLDVQHLVPDNNGSNQKLLKEGKELKITLVEGLDVQHPVPDNNDVSQDLLKEGKDLKIILKNAKKLSDEEKDNILRFSGQKPFLVEYNERSKSYIQAALEVLGKSINRKHNLKLIIIGKKIDSSQLPKELKVLKNLHDLSMINTSLFKEIMQKFKISLQGKKNVYIGKVNSEITELITISDLLASLKGNLIIGEKEERVFENYMSRFVTAPCFSSEFLLKLKSDLLVINCGEHLEQIKKKLQGIASNKKIMQIQEIGDTSLKNEIILTVDDLFLQDFRKYIAEFKGNVHYFKTIGEDSFQWIETVGNIQNLKSDDKLTLNKIPESDIFTHFKNTVNVICAQPGMGKSVMMEQLRINSPSDIWGVKMEFRELESTFEKFTDNFDENFHNFEHEFLKKTAQNGLQTQIVHVLTTRRQIYFFFDGLDELQSKHLETAMNFMKELSTRGFKLWISARKNLQDILEKYFNVLALNIEEIPRETQVYYVEDRLQYSHDSQEIQEVIQKIFTNLHVLSNSEVLGVPLQLFILTEVLIDDKKCGNEFHENIFIMTKMYESFFSGKIKHYLDKTKSQNYEDFENLLYEYYEKAALKSCLDDEFFNSFNIQEFDRCLNYINKDISKIGIITKIINGRPVFHHNTHGEYFVACYFARNRDREWDKNYLFQAKYKNIRLMLDIKLAEKSEPHLSVIYKDLERLRAFDRRQIKCKDQAGRSPLHLACSYGETFPLLNVKKNVIHDGDKHDINESKLYLWRKIVKFLLENNCSPFENDDFLKLNAIQYADAYLCLAAFEEILEIKRDNERQFRKNFKKSLKNYSKQFSSIIYYSAKFNFVNLFGFVKHSFDTFKFNPLKSFFNRGFRTLLMTKNQENETLLHIAAENKRIDMVNLILAESVSKKLINAVDIYSRTVLDVAILVQDPQIQKILKSKGAVTKSEKYPFHRAASNGCDKMIKLLLSQQSDDLINSVDDRNWTALHHACRSGHLLTCELLINSGASIEPRMVFGETPLFLSVMFCRFEIMNLLLAKGANVKSRNQHRESLLHVVVRKGTVEVLKNILEKKKADTFTETYYNTAALKSLLDAKADIGAKDNNGEEALHVAARYNNTAALKILLDAKADIGAKNKLGQQALHLAATPINTLRLRLDVEAYIRAKDNNGKRALHFDEIYYKTAALKCLLDAKADIGAKDNNGEEALHYAARFGNRAALKILLDAKADIGAKDKLGRQALHMAVRAGCDDVVKFLVNDFKADVNAVTNAGESALHLAAADFNYSLVRLLVNLRVNVNALDNKGRTALLRAKTSQYPYGYTPLGKKKTVKQLIDAGAKM